jgi:hypothetical protein
LVVDASHEKRLNSSEWFNFLSRSRFTLSSEAGAKFIFRDDEIWKPVKEYIKDHIQLEPDEDVYFDHYNPSSLQYIIDTQHKIIDYMKNKNYKKLFQILIVIDDFCGRSKIC